MPIDIKEYELTDPNEVEEVQVENVTDLSVLDREIINNIRTPYKTSKEQRLEETTQNLNKVFEIYNRKYGTDLSAESLEALISRMINLSSIDNNKIEYIKENFLYNYGRYLKFKLIVTIFKTIEKNIDHLVSLPLVLDGVDAMQIATIDKLWYWLDKVNTLIEEFKTDDFDSLMRSLQPEESDKEDDISAEDVNKIIGNIYNQLKNELKGENNESKQR